MVTAEVDDSDGKTLSVAYRKSSERNNSRRSEREEKELGLAGELGFSNITTAGHGVPCPLPSTFQIESNGSHQPKAKEDAHTDFPSVLAQYLPNLSQN
jgi:hypothetical protein